MVEDTQVENEVGVNEEVIDADIPSLEDMEEVALRALGRMTLQDLIDDSVLALVEVSTARPQSYFYDAAHYNDEDREQPSPFMDLIQYLKEVQPVEFSGDSTT